MRYDVAIGSRKVKGSIIPIKQTIPRRFASWGFMVIVKTLFNLPVRDTQLGAKAFTRQAALEVINNVQTNGWAFDTDALWTLHKMGYRIKEVPIKWQDCRGSQLNIPKASYGMFIEILKLRFRHKSTGVVNEAISSPTKAKP